MKLSTSKKIKVTNASGDFECPECGEELAGDGENHLECIGCDFVIHELDILE